jgi:phosphopantetheinyl transferase
VGIDAEHVEAPAMTAVRQDAARSGEAELPWPHNDWPARLWCAKESVVKAERVGADLLGRTLKVIQVIPHSATLNADASRADVLEVLVVSHKGNTFRVSTGRIGSFVTASVRERLAAGSAR